MSDPNQAPESPHPTDDGAVLQKAARSSSRTPLYEASFAARYDRQLLIKELQARTGRRLITYVAGIEAAIDRDDTLAFADLLHNVPHGQPLDLLLHTPGGDIDAAEKLVYMVRKKIGGAALRVIVPDYAKSAGTLMVLGADSIIMSDSSELGPIDPQVVRGDVNGNRIAHSIFNYLHAYEALKKELEKNPDSLPARMLFSKFDPETIKWFESTRERARQCAETFLKQGMFSKEGNWSDTVNALLDVDRWRSHGQLISWEAAVALGLVVEYRAQDDALWAEFWRLYCRQRVAINPRQKVFESDHVSHILDAGAGGHGGNANVGGAQ